MLDAADYLSYSLNDTKRGYVDYSSCSLNDTKRRYAATEQECYAVGSAVTSLRPYINGKRFKVRTDYDGLR